MPTYLELSQQVHKLAQVQGSLVSVTEPGINGEIATLVQKAWTDIQNLRSNFEFMRKTLAFTLAAGTSTYSVQTLFQSPAVDDLSRWIDEPNSLYLTSPDGNQRFSVRPIDYDTLRDLKRSGPVVQEAPRFWAHEPSNLSVMFFQTPGLNYAMELDYYRSPQILVSNADVPHIRSQWHDIIVYKATADLAAGKSIHGLYQRFELRYNQRLGDLLRAYVPGVSATIRAAA